MKIGTMDNIKDRICQYCQIKFQEISGSKFANHVRWCKQNPNLDIEFEKYSLQIANQISNDKRYGPKQYYIVECQKCLNLFTVYLREKTFLKKKKFFCSRSCCNSRPHTEEDKLKIKNCICKNGKTLSENSKDLWLDSEYSKKVLLHNPRFTSKGELKLRTWFITNFPDEEWTYGGSLKYKEIYGIVRDLYSKKLKISIEYDGEWHFRNLIDNQLESKQLKDKALENWSIDSGWRLIRIRDEIFQKDPNLWIKKIRSEVENPTSNIVKFY